MERLIQRWQAGLAALPGLVALAGGVVLGSFDAGFAPAVWYPAALFILALLVLAVVAAWPRREERSRLVLVGLGLYALFCVWSYLSILWAEVPGDAWQGANRTLLYGLVLAVVALRPWSEGAVKAALALVALGTAAFAVGVLVASATLDDPSELFLRGRLSDPVGYANANASLFLIGFFPAAHLASTRLVPWPLRGLCLAGATVLLGVALLTQSRGAAIALGITAVVYVVLVPRRWPALLAIAVPVLLTAAAFDPLTAVRDARTPADLGPAMADARGPIALNAGVAFALGAVAALVGGRLRPALSGPRVVRAGNLGLTVLAVAAVVAAVVAIGSPGQWVEDRWDDFRTSGYSSVEAGGTRFGGSLGSNRYDFYRVALDLFEEHPVRGIGAENFSGPYLERRRSGEAPRHPHSLAFRLLAQLGVVGAGLFIAFLATMLVAATRASRRAAPAEAGLGVAAMAAFAVWFVQALADWLWAFAGLGVLAFGLLGAAARLRSRAEAEALGAAIAGEHGGRGPLVVGGAEKRRSGPRSIATRAVIAAITLAAALSLALPGIAARYTRAAYTDYREQRGTVFARLDRAADFDPLSAEPPLAKGVIAQRLGRPGVARDALLKAIDREPENWFAHLELGLVQVAAGERRAGLESLAAARRLNPREPVVQEAFSRAEAGRTVDPTAVEARLNRQFAERLRPTDPE